MLGLGIFAAAFALYGLVAVRAERLGVSRALAFVVAGALVAVVGWATPLPKDQPAGLLLHIAEVALALVLFADASRMGLVPLRRNAVLPLRLIGPGMLAAIGLGALLAAWLFGTLDWWECAALAVILAPTDVSLCAAAVHDQQVPARIRLALDAESGLNDGAAVPLLLLFVAGATVAEGIRPASFWATTALEKIGIGVLAGVVVGLVAGELARRARRAGSSTPTSEGLALAGVAVAAYVFTQELGGSGLVAAFVAGLAAGTRLSREDEPALGFAEAEGAVAATFVFFALGLVGVELLDELTWRECAYAVLSLVVVRPLAVALALVGTRLRWPTVAFVGWFGPRGLASVVLALIVLAEDHELPGIDTLTLTALVTVLLSIVVHGLSAGPLTRRYVAWAGTLPRDARELGRVPRLPGSRGVLHGRLGRHEPPSARAPSSHRRQ